MTTKVEKSVLVNVPVSTAYNQWTQFEDFPQFMEGVESVTHLSDDRLDWVAEIAVVRRQWQAKILEQVADQRSRGRPPKGPRMLAPSRLKTWAVANPGKPRAE